MANLKIGSPVHERVPTGDGVLGVLVGYEIIPHDSPWDYNTHPYLQEVGIVAQTGFVMKPLGGKEDD